MYAKGKVREFEENEGIEPENKEKQDMLPISTQKMYILHGYSVFSGKTARKTVAIRE